MTFDDGILTICEEQNIASPGQKPVMERVEKARYYYSYSDLGIGRYYQAMTANQQIDCVVVIPGWDKIRTTDVCVLEDGDSYQIDMVQPTLDDENLRITKLSLERINQNYEVPGSDQGSASDGQ